MLMSKMINTNLWIILFIFLFSSSGISQQKSYIIDNEQIKTLDVGILWTKGWVPYYEITVLFKDRREEYDASMISGYQTTWSNPFVSHEVDAGEWVFLELIEDGELQLFKYSDRDFKPHFYVRKAGDETFHEISNKRRRSITNLKNLWTNCTKFKKLIDKANINESSLKRLIRAHNNCTYVHLPKFRKSIGIGVNNMSIFFSASRGYDSAIPGGLLSFIAGSKRNTSIAFEMNLDFPISDSDASFHTGLNFNSWKFDDFTFGGLGDIEYTTHLDFVDVHIPLGLKYTWPKRKLRPFVIGYFAPHFVISDKSFLRQDVITLNDGIFTRETRQDISRIGYSGSLAFGLSYHLSDDRIVYAKFGNLTRLNAQKPWIFNINSFYFIVGYTF